LIWIGFSEGWFYTTDYNDIAIKEVKRYTVSDQVPSGIKVKGRREEKD